MFLRIVEALVQHDEYFRMRVDASGRSSLSPLQKCTTVIRMLAYGLSADSMDDYIRFSSYAIVKDQTADYLPFTFVPIHCCIRFYFIFLIFFRNTFIKLNNKYPR
jgi:hypothetical protein